MDSTSSSSTYGSSLTVKFLQASNNCSFNAFLHFKISGSHMRRTDVNLDYPSCYSKVEQ